MNSKEFSKELFYRVVLKSEFYSVLLKNYSIGWFYRVNSLGFS